MQKINVTPLPFGLGALRRLDIPHKLGVLERLYGQRLKKYGTTRISCSNGIEWKLNLEDACQRWIVYGDYEGSAHLDWMRNWMENGGVYVDSGANIGQMLLYIAPLPGVRAVAFEPLPEAMLWLRECTREYERNWDVTLVELGLADKPARLILRQSGAQSTMREDWYTQKKLDAIEVQVDTFDNQLEILGVDRVRLWKLDVEGCEAQVLRGAAESFRKAIVDALLVEVCAPNFHEVKELLAASNYKLRSLDRSGKLCDAPDLLSGTTNLLAFSPRI